MNIWKRLFGGKPKESHLMQIPKSLDPLVIVVSRQEVEDDDISRPLSILKQLTESADAVRSCFKAH